MILIYVFCSETKRRLMNLFICMCGDDDVCEAVFTQLPALYTNKSKSIFHMTRPI